MKMKHDKGYGMYGAQHNPNAGENQTHFSGNAGGSSSSSIDGAGVATGLSDSMKCEVKNLEDVCQEQRPKARSTQHGAYKIGI